MRFMRASSGADRRISCWDEFRALPFTTKTELAEDQLACPPYGTNLTYPLERYIKFHQTSGTTGKAPIRWLDTEESWDWWARCWGHVFRGAGVGPGDRVFYAFSFGPFIGFWAAYEGARKVGAMTMPGGGMQTEQRLQAMRRQLGHRAVLHADVRVADGRGGRAEGHRAGATSAYGRRCTPASRARACPGDGRVSNRPTVPSATTTRA